MREQIKPRRIALGLKRRPLALLAGVTYPTIANIEGNPDKYVTEETIVKVWRALDDYERAGNSPATTSAPTPVDEEAERFAAVERRLAELEAEYGISPGPATDASSRVEQVEGRLARIEAAMARAVAPASSIAPRELQPSGSLDQSIAAQRQRSADLSRKRPRK